MPRITKRRPLVNGWTSEELSKIGTAEELRIRPCDATARCAVRRSSGWYATAMTFTSDR
jgi:hypothetical protein